MKMSLRWFGSKYDTVKLEYIRQIPGVDGVITTPIAKCLRVVDFREIRGRKKLRSWLENPRN